ncbi:hypothetical protein D9K79_15040 [Acinetobacter cumulans]|uniref:DUF4156 domain-containing protein n=1 Tax=Acinetobacter cumulans TaxID=2136182 RepID=A0ABX9U3C3_9GAMM|nr:MULTISPECIES: hypothetical protein [Acinetobacter]RKG44365.1 hypothetical protein D7V51_07685 [Acinetobacter cumulans]RLL39576.1 hypothetical protein D9K79_15040 [Acinetobacter cumulans]RZG57838.1 hypothetical protein EXE29_12660 [Acinetobacter sp. WCHAc060006]
MKFNQQHLWVTSSLASVLLLSACASTPTQSLAIQKPNNQYEVTAVGKTQLIAKNNAISAANSTCGKSASPVVVDEKTEYNGALKGVLDEKTGQMVQAAAGILGSISGTNTGLNKDDDYQTVLTFSCRAN